MCAVSQNPGKLGRFDPQQKERQTRQTWPKNVTQSVLKTHLEFCVHAALKVNIDAFSDRILQLSTLKMSSSAAKNISELY